MMVSGTVESIMIYPAYGCGAALTETRAASADLSGRPTKGESDV